MWSDILSAITPKKTKVIHKQPLGWIHFSKFNLFQPTISFTSLWGSYKMYTGGSESNQLVVTCLFWKCTIYTWHVWIHRDGWQLGVCVCVRTHMCMCKYMHSNSSSRKNKHNLNMSGVSTEYLRKDKIGLVFLTSRECNSLLASQIEMLAPTEDLFYRLVSAHHLNHFQ